MVQKDFIKLKIDDIISYENNPRINDDAVKDVIESIKQTENLDPIEIDENNVILSGHTRLKALKKLGYKECEVVRYTGLCYMSELEPKYIDVIIQRYINLKSSDKDVFLIKDGRKYHIRNYNIAKNIEKV